MSKKYPKAKTTFIGWFSLSLILLGWGYSSRDILKIDKGRLTLMQTSHWGSHSRLVEQRTIIKDIDGRIAKNAPPTRSTRKFELAILDDEGNPVTLPTSMRMRDWQINRAVKHFNQAITQGSYQISGYPHVMFLVFGYISLFISLLYGLESRKND